MSDDKKIEVVPYQSDWAHLYERLKTQLEKSLQGHMIECHHIGSTSVPNLWAKPIIDMVPVVDDLGAVDRLDLDLKSIGLESLGEFGIFSRRFYCLKDKDRRIANIHIYPSNHDEIKRHVLFRDYLLAHPQAVEEYSKLKQQLAQQHPDDIVQYLNGKEAFIKRIDRLAGFKGTRLVEPRSDTELGAFKSLIPNTKAKGNQMGVNKADSSHIHAVFYEGQFVVGAIELNVEDITATIFAFTIDKTCQKRGLGAKMLSQIESWLTQKDVNQVIIEANASSSAFFIKYGYQLTIPSSKTTQSSTISLSKSLLS